MKKQQGIRQKLEEIVFGVETPAGRAFDVVLIWAIVLSILVVVLESVKPFQRNYGELFWILEWFFTILFTIEYLVRIWISKKPLRYIQSGLGVIDVLSILPSYLSLIFVGTQYLMTIRILRLLRIFRILKLNHYLGQANFILEAMRRSYQRILVFLFGIVHLVLILGAIMYVVEGEASGFDSIPRSVYWAIVTITTVGYGDISPATPLGQFIASFIMIIGYAIIAVPTGIMTVEMNKASQTGQTCKTCEKSFQESQASFCPHCGAKV
ncbi:MAG: ion transporter [Saprospirales bacterium]|nr:ion transporter [Saprospirales bacterium]MBK8492405.1 ion transporter [Saprospirales bacterium]